MGFCNLDLDMEQADPRLVKVCVLSVSCFTDHSTFSTSQLCLNNLWAPLSLPLRCQSRKLSPVFALMLDTKPVDATCHFVFDLDGGIGFAHQALS